MKTGLWQKENALLRDNKGHIRKTPDITGYEYIVFAEPLKPGEKVNIAGITVQYDPAIPVNIFKLNQLGSGIRQKKKYAYRPSPTIPFDSMEADAKRSGEYDNFVVLVCNKNHSTLNFPESKLIINSSTP